MTNFIADHVRFMRASGLSERTIGARVELLLRAAAKLPFGLDVVAREDIIDWAQAQPWRPATRFIYDWHLRSYYAWAEEFGYLDFNPMAGLPVPRNGRRRRPRPVTDAQLVAILSTLSAPFLLYATLAADAGLRSAEIAQLDRADIHERWILVRHGKGDKERRAVSTPRIWHSVRDFPPGPVAVTCGGRDDPRWVSHRTHAHMSRAVGENCGLHRLRAYHATLWRRAGADPYMIRDQLGHASIATTESYVAAGEEERLLVGSTLPLVQVAS